MLAFLPIMAKNQQKLINLQLMIEREKIILKQFCLEIKFNRKTKLFSIPGNINQDNLPLAFQYYNYIFKIS